MNEPSSNSGRSAAPEPVGEVLEVVLPGLVEPEGLQLVARPGRAPAAGRVLLRMEATGVSFAEQQMRRGKYYDQPSFPFIPGYDLVGTVEQTGAGVDPGLSGRRFAAVVKIGAWADVVEVDAAQLLPIPDGIDPGEAETLVVNGITAWQMLHRTAKVRAGSRVLVLGANGGAGTALVQLARAAGAEVIGAAAPRHHPLLTGLGARPIDSHAPDLTAEVRALAPDGVDAVFDPIGGPGIRDSWRLLGRGGTLVSYGSAATKNDAGRSQLPVLALLMRLAIWNALPNRRAAHFYNFWAGRRRTDRFQQRQRDAFIEVMRLLMAGEVQPQIAARFPLDQVVAALRLAESRTVAGKVLLTQRT